ncbi:MAG: metallophosphoesterase [Acidobacteria bacterium]|nr:metallophosphoesterase [Acidobacteriota bacterium]
MRAALERYSIPVLLAAAGGVVVLGKGVWVMDALSRWAGWAALVAGVFAVLAHVVDSLWTGIRYDNVDFPDGDLKIAHLSDLHYPTSSGSAAHALRESLAKHRPDILVVTGDLQNHPFARRRGAAPWIYDTKTACGITSYDRVIVMPGNHDVFFWGLLGIGCFGEWLFRRTYIYSRRRIIFVERAKVAFFCLDLNPLWAVGSAEGTVYEHRLRALQEAIDQHPKQHELMNATRVLLIHQHPFPVPFGGGDFLLATKETHRLLRFVAEQRIDLILHGHKHYATWSDLRVGGAADTARFVQVLGAGSAMKENDYDTRGHNYNLITISSNGVRRVRQFFRATGETHFTEKAPSPAEHAMQSLAGPGFGARYGIGEMEWGVKVRGDGSATNRYSLRNIRLRDVREPEIAITGHQDVGGHVSEYVKVDGPAEWDFRAVGEEVEGRPPGCRDYVLQCAGATGRDSDSVTLQGHEFGSYALDGLMAMHLHMPLLAGTTNHEDTLKYTLREAVSTMILQVEFPDGFPIRGESLRVYESDGVTRNLRPGGRELPAVAREGQKICVRIATPEPGLVYQLSWLVAAADAEFQGAAVRSRRQFFSTMLWARRETDKDLLNLALALAGQAVLEALRHAMQAKELPGLHHDLSIMIPLDGDSSRLGVLTGLRVPDMELQLKVGQGNAGIAYLSGTARYFDVQKARRDPAANTYIPGRGGVHHTFMASYVLKDLVTKLPFAVVNFGALDAATGEIMTPLAEEECQKKIVTALHRDVLPLLLQAAMLEGNDPDRAGDGGIRRGEGVSSGADR